MRILIVFIGLLCTGNVLGQIQHDVRKSLEAKDFIAFKKYADGLSKNNKTVNSYWEYLRDVTDEFREGVFVFEKSEPDEDNPAISSVCTFRATILTTKAHITYYELSELKNRKKGDDWEPYYDPIARFKDKKQFDRLRDSFRNIFKAELNENELFITDFVYGEHCGYVGADPKGRQQTDQWVATKNKAGLLTWLKSVNTEKQLYAVDGLFQLKKLGVEITDEELLILKFITAKNGTVYVCSGCLYSHDKISDVSGKFKRK